MRKHFKNDCSHCHDYPTECDECYSEVKASMHLKTRCRNKKRDINKDNNLIYNN